MTEGYQPKNAPSAPKLGPIASSNVTIPNFETRMVIRKEIFDDDKMVYGILFDTAAERRAFSNLAVKADEYRVVLERLRVTLNYIRAQSKLKQHGYNMVVKVNADSAIRIIDEILE